MKQQIIQVPEHQAKIRLDVFLANFVPKFTREQAQRVIKGGLIAVDGVIVTKSSFTVHTAKEIVCTFPFRHEVELIAQDIPLNIIYEDEDIVVINKPAGLVVHPAQGNWDGTLVNAILGKSLHEKNFEEQSLRLGLVHRLDKLTSGVIVVCKNDHAKALLGKQFHDRVVKKTYFAVVHGRIEPTQGRIESFLGRSPRDRKKMAIVDAAHGKKAITEYKVIEQRKDTALLELQLLTGRTHQIRVHCASMGWPIVGDTTYGYPQDEEHFHLGRHLLHAWKLGCILPSTGEWVEFVAEVPTEFSEKET